MKDPKYSIIVPIWNGAKYIDRCVESLLNQKIDDYEVILIDNNSSDSSLAKANYWANINSHVLVYEEMKKGASNARNLGIKKAKGKYITFADIDDTVSSDFLLTIENLENEDDIDLFVISSLINMGQPKLRESEQLLEFTARTEEEIADAFSRGFLMETAPWSKFFRSSILQKYNISFPTKVIVGEDAIFLFTYLCYTKKIKFSSNVIYNYMYNDTSITKRYYKLNQEWLDYSEMKKAVSLFAKHVHLSRNDKKLWSILTSRLRRYIKAILATNEEKKYWLSKISEEDTKNYGKGQILTVRGRLFQFIVNHRLFRTLILLNRIERII